MVESGLETRVSVSQYRLAIHLGVALILFAAILWTALEYLKKTPSPPSGREGKGEGVLVTYLDLDAPSPQPSPPLRGGEGVFFAFTFVALVYLQMLLGALVAGLHAGLVYNTWPSMDGRFFPEGAFSSRPWWINFFENPGLAQFDHRLGAYIVAIAAVFAFVTAIRARLSEAALASAYAILIVTVAQIALGIVTLLNQAPILLSALHQTTALALLSVAIWHTFEIHSPRNGTLHAASA